MKISLSEEKLRDYVFAQINSFVPDSILCLGQLKIEDIQVALSKCDFCFKHIRNNAFSDDEGNTFFSHVHADQYGMFLVYLSNFIWLDRQDKILCDRIMYLNRVLHSFMMSYKAKVPDIMWLAHPVGTVIGNADYSDYLYISQNCTINTGETDKNGNLRPKIGKFFAMGAGAALIGNEPVGDFCSIGVNAMVYNTTLEDHSIVINKDGENIIKLGKASSFAEKLFR